MSAWMVSNETLSELANTIATYCVTGFNGFGFEFPRWITNHFIDKTEREIFDELALMNIDSLAQRYPKDYMEGVINYDSTKTNNDNERCAIGY